jgi:hypothetical protein
MNLFDAAIAERRFLQKDTSSANTFAIFFV